jgi:hypothetical protein
MPPTPNPTDANHDLTRKDIQLVPEPTEEYLTPRQLEDHTAYQDELVRWLLNMGKDPD